MGKMGGVGSIEPPSFEEDDDDEEEFAQSRKVVKKRDSSRTSGKADSTANNKIEKLAAKVDMSDEEEDDDDDDVDLFSAPMNSEAFMAQIKKNYDNWGWFWRWWDICTMRGSKLYIFIYIFYQTQR